MFERDHMGEGIFFCEILLKTKIYFSKLNLDKKATEAKKQIKHNFLRNKI